METVVVLVIAAPILLLNRRLLSRLFSLEQFLQMCGMCPDWYEKAKSALR